MRTRTSGSGVIKPFHQAAVVYVEFVNFSSVYGTSLQGRVLAVDFVAEERSGVVRFDFLECGARGYWNGGRGRPGQRITRTARRAISRLGRQRRRPGKGREALQVVRQTSA